jgi:hypothetical protein
VIAQRAPGPPGEQRHLRHFPRPQQIVGADQPSAVSPPNVRLDEHQAVDDEQAKPTPVVFDDLGDVSFAAF